MAFHEEEAVEARSQSRSRRTQGWTALHSWIFLAIVAVGLVLMVLQNRYHYLSPLGLGKAYRIDKLFGSIQEFDPSDGWIAARLMGAPQPQPSGMVPPPGMGSQAVPMHMPAPRPGEAPSPMVGAPSEQPPPGPAVARTESPAPREPRETQPKPTVREAPPRPKEMSREERLELFLKTFPDYGEEEFQLASDDLYPDWKKAVGPQGTWREFLQVYKEFVEWWVNAGSPAEPGAKLWKDFMASKRGN